MNRSDFGKNERNIPPCGRLIEYREPHSPFQKLIDERRKRFGLSGRDLAERIGVSQSTVWIWLHNLNGYPHPKSFKPEHLSKISEVLKIPEGKIRSALDASRHIFTPRENPRPYAAFDVFGHFIQILQHDERKHLSKEYVLNLARNLHRGAKVTLLALTASIALSVAASADDLLTTSGKRYENVQVTEITPVSITVRHATGVVCVPFSEFDPVVRQKYGYDEAKARTWVSHIAEQQRQQADAAVKARYDALRNYEKTKVEMEKMKSMLNAVYDPMLHRWYPSAEEASAAREQALKDALELKFLQGK
jgi:transcriptional regulator with XRE-family HTH domain